MDELEQDYNRYILELEIIKNQVKVGSKSLKAMKDGGMVQLKAVIEESRENLMKTLSGRVPWLKQKSVPRKSKMRAESNHSQVNGSSFVVGSIEDDEYYITGSTSQTEVKGDI
jgi:hypothetical protein